MARASTIAAAVFGALVGGLIGLGVGFLLYMLARTFVLPTTVWSDDAPMVGLMAITAAAFAFAGARNALRPSRGSRKAMRAILFFFPAALAGALLAVVLGMIAAEVFSISQMEGAYAMGIVFGIAPLAALAAGIAGSVWGWRRG